MTLWFRVYSGIVDDPKIQRLDPPTFKALINLWCLASDNDGVFPPVDEIAFKLRMKPEKVRRLLNELRLAGLVDDDERGARPHNWDKRQFISDVSTPRVKRFRERRGNASATGSETVPETEAEGRKNPSQGGMNSGDEVRTRANGWRAPS